MKLRRPEAGFTLLEFIIALAILVVVLAAVYIAQSGSLLSSSRTRNIVIATNLARNFIGESENKLEGVKFENLAKEETGQFPEPNAQFRWKREVSEVDFSALTEIFMSQFKQDKNAGVREEESMVAKLFEAYMKDSVRKLVITVEWQEGDKPQTLSFTSLLVNYDADFAPGL